MEILATAPVMILGPLFWIILGTFVLSAICAFIGAVTDCDALAYTGLIISIAMGILIIARVGTIASTTEAKYTVQITDQALFKQLVEKGYTFKKLFDSKDIYKIIGEIIK